MKLVTEVFNKWIDHQARLSRLEVAGWLYRSVIFRFSRRKVTHHQNVLLVGVWWTTDDNDTTLLLFDFDEQYVEIA